MADLKDRVSELAQLMAEFGLEEAKLSGEDWSVEFSRRNPNPISMVGTGGGLEPVLESKSKPAKPKTSKPVPSGIPISSPMMGIFYNAPSPGAPTFVNEGDQVVAGQVVGLIEAMKVFNEISATVGGTVLRLTAEPGSLVQPGDPLLYIG